MFYELQKLALELNFYGSNYNQHAEVEEINQRYIISIRDTSGATGRESTVLINDTALLPIISFAAAHGYAWRIQAYGNEKDTSAKVDITLYPEADR